MQTAIWQPYQNQDVMVFGIAIDEPTAVVANFVRQFQLTYPVVLGDQDLYNDYRIGGSHVSPYPRDFIIGKDGLIAYASDEYDPAAMIQVIESEINVSGLDDNPSVIVPVEIELMNSYPNPVSLSREIAANQSVTIEYKLNKFSDVTFSIFDVTGALVTTVSSNPQNPGEHIVRWDGRDSRNRLVNSGIYFARIQTQSAQLTRKIILVR